MTEKLKTRRGLFRALVGVVGVAGASHAAGRAEAAPAQAAAAPERQVHWRGDPPENPLFAPAVTYGNLVFIAGKGAHFPGDIRAHTDHVLKVIEEDLVRCGSSMDKVLKATVYLHDLDDFQGMNEVFRGRFGPNPPVRSTVACRDGIPGNSLVEIDVIAFR